LKQLIVGFFSDELSDLLILRLRGAGQQSDSPVPAIVPVTNGIHPGQDTPVQVKQPTQDERDQRMANGTADLLQPVHDTAMSPLSGNQGLELYPGTPGCRNFRHRPGHTLVAGITLE